MFWWIVGGCAVAWFVYNGFRTRCPACGKYGLHRKDKAEHSKQRERYEALKDSELGDSQRRRGQNIETRYKPGYANSRLRCKKCRHLFGRKLAIEWLRISNKHGDDLALREYCKLQQETDDV